ncbi:DNA-binding transcriptional response regulator [Paracraurococcus ruber]|uniref:Response regulatory domain-containing protein n=1 Tax=Paracraurococcus ruber TaxID=77675 RepID=A0ABS1CXL0_9PROT|nr:response regulator [Paracraurococcus ruber]MBK1659155.1 hypothetical protein [Paracraurococcus ruber]TDG29874.1 response regulator [Paracraurococcus ruber]
MEDVTKPVALVVEHEAALALLIEDLLAETGFDTVFAATEADALRKASAIDRIAAAVVNPWVAGALVGQRVIRALRQRIPDLPVVVITCFDKLAPQADLRGVGWPTIRLHAPYDYDELVPAMRTVIEQARTGDRPVGGRRRGDIA